mgnify:CR=1 FL=1
MAEEKIYTPAEAAQHTNASAATIRRYSDRFAKHLSPAASPGKGKPRLYSVKDVYMLQAINRLSAQQLTYEQIEAELEQAEPLPDNLTLEPEKGAEPELPAPYAIMQSQAEALQRLAAQGEHLQALGSSLNTLASTQAEQSALLTTQAQQLTAQEQHISAVLTGQDQRLERLAEEVRIATKSRLSTISAVLLVALGAALALAAVGIALWLLPAG